MAGHGSQPWLAKWLGLKFTRGHLSGHPSQTTLSQTTLSQTTLCGHPSRIAATLHSSHSSQPLIAATLYPFSATHCGHPSRSSLIAHPLWSPTFKAAHCGHSSHFHNNPSPLHCSYSYSSPWLTVSPVSSPPPYARCLFCLFCLFFVFFCLLFSLLCTIKMALGNTHNHAVMVVESGCESGCERRGCEGHEGCKRVRVAAMSSCGGLAAKKTINIFGDREGHGCASHGSGQPWPARVA